MPLTPDDDKPHNIELEDAIQENARLRRELDETRKKSLVLEAVFNAAQDHIFVKDADMRYVMANPSAKRFVSASPRDLIGKTSEVFFAPQIQKKIKETDRRALQGEVVELNNVRERDGQTQHVHIIKVPLKDENGKTWGLCGISRDVSELINTRSQLRRVEAQRALLLDSASELVVFYGLDMKVKWANKAASQILGLHRDELIGYRCQDIWPQPEGEEGCFCQVCQTLDSGQTTEGEHVSSDGRIWSVRSYPVRDENGKPAGAIEMGRDISKEKEFQQKLLESEAKFRTLVQNSTDIILRVDRQMRLVFINNAVKVLAGVEPEELIGKGPREVGLPPSEAIFWEQSIKEVLEKGRPITSLRKIEGPDFTGYYRWQLLPEFDGEGNVHSIVGICHDETANKKTELELQRSQQRFASLYASMEEGVVMHELVYDDQGKAVDYRIMDVNPAFEKHTGLSRKEALGALASELYGAGEPPYLQTYAEVAQSGVPFNFETYFPPLDKHFSISAVSPEKGRFATIFRDISARKRDEQRRIMLEDQLRQAQKMEALGTLAGGIAHDFNNILGAIMGYTELSIEEAKQGRPAGEELSGVLKAAHRARDLVKQILTFSRKSEISLKPLELNNAITDAVKMLERLIPETVKIEQDLDSRLTPIFGDAGQMQQLIINLGSNASDAMPDGGAIVIKTCNRLIEAGGGEQSADLEPGLYAELQVSDNGHGMEPEIMRQIFDPFFTTKDTGFGTGLGLSTVYGIVKGHGGTIKCESKPGQGARFTILLPTAYKDSMAEVDWYRFAGQGPSGRRSILLVDDEPGTLVVLRKLLSKEGFRVLSVTSGEACLQKLAQSAGMLDLVILDLTMPGMGGLACLQNIKVKHPKQKVIVLSGYEEKLSQAKYSAKGVYAAIRKPFNPADLINLVHRAILES